MVLKFRLNSTVSKNNNDNQWLTLYSKLIRNTLLFNFYVKSTISSHDKPTVNWLKVIANKRWWILWCAKIHSVATCTVKFTGHTVDVLLAWSDMQMWDPTYKHVQADNHTSSLTNIRCKNGKNVSTERCQLDAKLFTYLHFECYMICIVHHVHTTSSAWHGTWCCVGDG